MTTVIAAAVQFPKFDVGRVSRQHDGVGRRESRAVTGRVDVHPGGLVGNGEWRIRIILRRVDAIGHDDAEARGVAARQTIGIHQELLVRDVAGRGLPGDAVIGAVEEGMRQFGGIDGRVDSQVTG